MPLKWHNAKQKCCKLTGFVSLKTYNVAIIACMVMQSVSDSSLSGTDCVQDFILLGVGWGCEELITFTVKDTWFDLV